MVLFLEQKRTIKNKYIQPPLQYCPICHAATNYSSRYPQYICADCKYKITDIHGERIVFGNTEIFGHGLQGYYVKDKQQKYEGNVCYVNGIECYAGEAYFGGIVIQKNRTAMNKKYDDEKDGQVLIIKRKCTAFTCFLEKGLPFVEKNFPNEVSFVLENKDKTFPEIMKMLDKEMEDLYN